jgi:hypothetical protein
VPEFPFGSGLGVTIVGGAVESMVSVNAFDAVTTVETVLSCTRTVKLNVPGAVGVPVRSPEGLNDIPAGRLPVVTTQFE